MGYFFGLYAFSGRRKYLIKSLFLPMIFHAIYNFMTTLSLLITALILIALITYARSLHRRLARLQNGKTKEEEREIIDEICRIFMEDDDFDIYMREWDKKSDKSVCPQKNF